MRDFPDGFLWGSATAAHQVEGGNVNNDWWAWEHAEETTAVEPSGDAIDQYHYVESHLDAVRRALAEGLDVRGYLYWSSFDNLEWAEGFRPTFGLVGIDRSDNLRRVVRPSAAAFGRVARSGRLADLRSV
jgi:beta-glucosidase/6-phospho-beta-glucosidase/beta-galactosidase